MRAIPPTVLNLLGEGKITLGAAIWIDAPNMSIWAGGGTLTMNYPTAATNYIGLEAPAMYPGAAFEIGNSANGIEVTLASTDARLIPSMIEQDFRGRDVIVYRLYFDEHATGLLHVEPFFYGSIDKIVTRDTPGGYGVISVQIEGEARGSQRTGGRIASDQDQRLVDGTDTSMRYIALAGEIKLIWGGKPPQRAGSALNMAGLARSIQERGLFR